MPSRRLVPLAVAAVLAPLAQAWAQEPSEGEEAVEEVIVQATRTGRRVQDEPIRVEVLSREEIEEKMLMRPGAISMVVAETGGLRVQTTSSSLGASNIRVQGMRGRYTQLLADGLPLYGGQSIGLLQIPPTDLGQVEVIKGAASALYGSSALGGVINLVSRKPREAAVGEVLLNLTSRNGQDLTAYGDTPLGEKWSASLTGGLHRQSRQDLDDDGWTDMARYERWTLRPRLFWNADNGAAAFLTLGAMGEEREGGSMPGRTAPDGQPFPEAQKSRRLDAGLNARTPLGDQMEGHLRASAMTQDHKHRFGEVVEDDRHRTFFAEASVSGGPEGTSWLAGLAIQSDDYRSDAFPAFDYTYTVPGLFAQVEHDLSDVLTVAGSARFDRHDEYGSRLSPRLSVMYRPGPWTVRASLGKGFYAPTPFVEEVDAAGLSRLEPLSGLKAETAETASLDTGYAKGPFEANLTVFMSHIHDGVRLEQTGPEQVRLVNAPGLTRTGGVEALMRYRWREFTVTGSYVYVDSSEPDPQRAGRRVIPLTPSHTAGMVAMWEKHGRGRVGLEAYYTGRQSLEDNPYRSEGKPYLEVGALGELTLGDVSLFLNLENILNIRQTKHDSLLLRARAPDGRWTVDAWQPLDGFVVNGGVRLRFGGGGH
ncbi:TonB-dependent receptor [Caulobacter segnis]|uniref:TonB-dependent receptor plug domain-containing protein n=1 Tax=Caulobacter segnis TaxID=88688 RepID=UPI00240FC7D2|nr:TonB-dependent receptor [Caulobacter segnis]MDG2523357.1 TonB-dependent receptor [Caulobacter segnis]